MISARLSRRPELIKFHISIAQKRAQPVCVCPRIWSGKKKISRRRSSSYHPVKNERLTVRGFFLYNYAFHTRYIDIFIITVRRSISLENDISNM